MRNDLSAVKEILATRAVEASQEEVIADEVIDDNIDEVIEEEEVTNEDAPEEEETNEETSEEEGVLDTEYTMKSLSDAIEMEMDDLYKVLIPLSDGNEPITIGEMNNQYQDLIKEKAGFETKIQELEQAQTQAPVQQQVSQAEFQAQVEMARVQDEYNKTDWKDLDEFDPGKSALLRQQFQDRYNHANNVMAQAGQYRQQEHSNMLTQAETELIKLLPAWSSSEVRTADEGKIAVIMRDAGYSEDIIKSNTDPISLKLLHELMTLREEKSNSAKLVKKVKKAPKTLKGQRIVATTNKDVTKNLISKAKKSRNKHDEFNAVKSLLSGKS